MMLILTIFAFVLSVIPALLFLANVRAYAPLPAGTQPGAEEFAVSILIPARNEEANISAALESVLGSKDVTLEVLVLDDHSTDRTAPLVLEHQQRDPRIRLVPSSPLPSGWCGKNFACHQLAQAARHPILLFMDADVRVSRPDALVRLAGFMQRSGAAFVSGVPHERTGTFLEKLIVPLIHFVLLGFLPIQRMRATRDPGFGAACGQIIAMRRDAYGTVGGHAAVANRLHEGLALARLTRSHGFATDLFDATDTFHCRMYQTSREVWHGFGKNAHESLASPQLIIPSTLLLLGGQVLPLLLLILATTPAATALAVAASVAAYLPRVLGIFLYRQPVLGALLHPLGIAALVGIQWQAFIRFQRRRPSTWKGRIYEPVADLASAQAVADS